MENVLRKAEVPRKSVMLSKGVQLLVYAGDIELIGRNNLDITVALSSIERQSIIGLAKNEGETKYTLAASN